MLQQGIGISDLGLRPGVPARGKNGDLALIWASASVLRTLRFCDHRISRFSSSKGNVPYFLTWDMVFHMKITLNIDDTVMAQLKREAARQGRTISELVETALRTFFRSSKKKACECPDCRRFGAAAW